MPEDDISLKFAKDHLAELGLPHDFDAKLLRDDDWSLVIKLHALMEVALTNAIVAHVGEEATRDLFSRMNVGGRSGKVAFAKALKCANETEIQFVQALSELRNQLVHDVHNVSFRLKEHIGSLDMTKRRTFVRHLFYLYVHDNRSMASLDRTVRHVLRKPKEALWRTGLHTIAILYLKLHLTKVSRETTLNKAKVAEAEHGPGARLATSP